MQSRGSMVHSVKCRKRHFFSHPRVSCLAGWLPLYLAVWLPCPCLFDGWYSISINPLYISCSFANLSAYLSVTSSKVSDDSLCRWKWLRRWTKWNWRTWPQTQSTQWPYTPCTERRPVTLWPVRRPRVSNRLIHSYSCTCTHRFTHTCISKHTHTYENSRNTELPVRKQVWRL